MERFLGDHRQRDWKRTRGIGEFPDPQSVAFDNRRRWLMADRYFASHEPWALKKTDPARMETVALCAAENCSARFDPVCSRLFAEIGR